MKKVAVVILSWNGKKYLEQFLHSVIKNTSTDLCEIVVADNCSTDGSVEYLQTMFPQVRVIQNKRNGGYAGGYNDALKLIDAEYFVLLNQDVEVTPLWVETVISEMEGDLKIAAAQPKLIDYNKRTCFEYAGASGGYVDALGYAYTRGRVFDTIEEDQGQYNDVVDVFWATGACLFIRSDAFRKAGGLDEYFFAHQEEIDLCWRLKSLGYRNIVVPSSVVFHVGGGSLQYGNARKTYLNFRNNLFLIFKNLPTSQLIWKLPVRMMLDGVAAIQSVWSNKNFKHLVAVLKAHFHFYVAIPSLIEKRNAIVRTTSAELSPVSIVWKYFASNKKKFLEIHPR